MSSATLAASASPHSSAIRCSARSMPAVMPALDATGPSTTKTRLSITSRRGARSAARRSSSWCVVQRRLPSKPARAASSVPEQIVTRRCGVARAEQRSPSASPQPPRGGDDRRRHLARGARSAGRPAPPRSARSARCGQRLEVAEGTARRRSRLVAAGPAKRRRKRGGSPRRSRCWLARRNASAGPAMSSSSECGTITNRTSIWSDWQDHGRCPKVIETCRPVRQRAGRAGTVALAVSFGVAFPLRHAVPMLRP